MRARRSSPARIAGVDRLMVGLGVTNAARMTDMLVPGFVQTDSAGPPATV